MTDMLMSDALKKYCTQVSILKKGYGQEKYRVEQLCRSFLGDKTARHVTSVDIATYRDARLPEINPRTNDRRAPTKRPKRRVLGIFRRPHQIHAVC